MTDGPIRPLTARQRQIADGIGRGWSYARIGQELHLAPRTVETYVGAMALLFDNPDGLSPRTRILLWVKHEEWAASHQRLARPA